MTVPQRLSIDERKEFACTIDALRFIVAPTAKSPADHSNSESTELWVTWKDALDWWGDETGLCQVLLKYSWRPGPIPGRGWLPGIEPIFWETIKAYRIGEFW